MSNLNTAKTQSTQVTISAVKKPGSVILFKSVIRVVAYNVAPVILAGILFLSTARELAISLRNWWTGYVGTIHTETMLLKLESSLMAIDDSLRRVVQLNRIALGLDDSPFIAWILKTAGTTYGAYDSSRRVIQSYCILALENISNISDSPFVLRTLGTAKSIGDRSSRVIQENSLAFWLVVCVLVPVILSEVFKMIHTSFTAPYTPCAPRAVLSQRSSAEAAIVQPIIAAPSPQVVPPDNHKTVLDDPAVSKASATAPTTNRDDFSPKDARLLLARAAATQVISAFQSNYATPPLPQQQKPEHESPARPAHPMTIYETPSHRLPVNPKKMDAPRYTNQTLEGPAKLPYRLKFVPRTRPPAFWAPPVPTNLTREYSYHVTSTPEES